MIRNSCSIESACCSISRSTPLHSSTIPLLERRPIAESLSFSDRYVMYIIASYHPPIRGASWERSIQLSYAIRSLENHHLAAGFELATSPSVINIVYNRTKRKAIRDQGDEPVEGLGRFGSDA